MQVVHDSSRYSHPANWAGYLLVGRDTVLRDRTQPLVGSMCSLLQASQEDYLVAALRHLLSMVSFSASSTKYTTRPLCWLNSVTLSLMLQ